MIRCADGLEVEIFFNPGGPSGYTSVFHGPCDFEWQGNMLVIIGPDRDDSGRVTENRRVYSIPRRRLGALLVLPPSRPLGRDARDGIPESGGRRGVPP